MTTTVEESVPFLTRTEIEDRATAVLRQHGLDSIPVDPVVLANTLEIAAHNANFFDDNIVGMIAKRGDRTTLLVKAAAPPYRKRFTVAHELGHYFLHLPGDGEFVDMEANLFRQPHEDQQTVAPERRREIQANLFATSLLMPEEAVRSAWKRLGSLAAAARKFKVSEAAMGIRIDQLGLE